MNLNINVQEEGSIVKNIDGIQPFDEMTAFKDIFPDKNSQLSIPVDQRFPTFLSQKSLAMVELFPTSTFNKLHLSPTSQRKPGCFTSSRTLTLPGTINIYNMGWRLASRAMVFSLG
ncbi:hypothetical protein TNCV_3842271 [Trichonephila clavipes]|nr:hypothetical protein TNCV_3842271 [Trichonephila clavipes]